MAKIWTLITGCNNFDECENVKLAKNWTLIMGFYNCNEHKSMKMTKKLHAYKNYEVLDTYAKIKKFLTHRQELQCFLTCRKKLRSF